MAKKTRRRPPPDGDLTEVGGSHPFSTTAFSSSSSSSSDFEFAISLSPASKKLSSQLCPADDLFYKGQLLPLQLSPRLSMVRTMILASSSGTSSSSDTTTTNSRDSNGSSNDSTASFSGDQLLLLAAAAAAECDSSRPSSVTEDSVTKVHRHQNHQNLLRSKYFTTLATKFSSVFNRNKKEHHHRDNIGNGGVDVGVQIPDSSTALPSCYFVPRESTKRRTGFGSSTSTTSSTAKEVIKKYVKKVKPLYEKLSSRQQSSNTNHQRVQKQQKRTFSFSVRRGRVRSSPQPTKEEIGEIARQEDSSREIYYSHSFSGNLRYPRKKRCSMATSCPSSPTHSGLLAVPPARPPTVLTSHHHSASATSMEELHSAIQGAIAHCKQSMARPTNKN